MEHNQNNAHTLPIIRKGAGNVILFREAIRSGYTNIPNVILRDPHLSLAAKGLLCILLSESPSFVVSVKGLSAMLGEGKAKMETALSCLSNIGYIHLYKPRAAGGSYVHPIYAVSDHPRRWPETYDHLVREISAIIELKPEPENRDVAHIAQKPEPENQDVASTTYKPNPENQDVAHIAQEPEPDFPDPGNPTQINNINNNNLTERERLNFTFFALGYEKYEQNADAILAWRDRADSPPSDLAKYACKDWRPKHRQKFVSEDAETPFRQLVEALMGREGSDALLAISRVYIQEQSMIIHTSQPAKIDALLSRNPEIIEKVKCDNNHIINKIRRIDH